MLRAVATNIKSKEFVYVLKLGRIYRQNVKRSVQAKKKVARREKEVERHRKSRRILFLNWCEHFYNFDNLVDERKREKVGTFKFVLMLSSRVYFFYWANYSKSKQN